MTRILTLLFTLSVAAMAIEGPTGVNQFDSTIWAAQRIENIKPYEHGWARYLLLYKVTTTSR